MRQMAKLPIDVYTQELCAAIDANDFPLATYDFGPEPDEEFDSERVVIHQNVIDVEGTIRRQLFSVGLSGVKDGLANVLFWGYSTLPGRRSNRVPRFRKKVTPSQLAIFSHVVRNMQGTGLVNIESIELPHLVLMPFVSRIRMLLDPDNYPVLDNYMADFANLEFFPPLKGLRIYTSNIPITAQNEQRYENWASWCRETAKAVNAYPDSPLRDLRATDVERGIAQLVKLGRRFRTLQILQGPQS